MGTISFGDHQTNLTGVYFFKRFDAVAFGDQQTNLTGLGIVRKQ